MVIVTFQGWSGLCQSINHSHQCSPTQAMLLTFKPTGLKHLYGGRHNSVGVVGFVSVNKSHATHNVKQVVAVNGWSS